MAYKKLKYFVSCLGKKFIRINLNAEDVVVQYLDKFVERRTITKQGKLKVGLVLNADQFYEEGRDLRKPREDVELLLVYVKKKK